MEIDNLSIAEIRDLLLEGKTSAVGIVEEHFKRIEEGDLNTFITLNKEEALESAKRVDEKILKGEELGSLAGIPVAIKDNIITKDLRTTAGSKMLENFIPPYESTVVEKIREADGIIIGKTNMDEFAMGSSSETSYYGRVKNPVDLDRVPGGSSGGSAAAVRAGEAILALGTDTGGSIRQPAAFCGVVGLKPTYGLVSRSGVISMANSLDQVGIVAKNVVDAANMLNIIAGEDLKDSTSLGTSYGIEELSGDIKGLKIGLPREFFEEEINPAIKEAILETVKLLEDLGAELAYVDMPHLKYSLSTYYLINTSEVSSNLSRFDGIRYGYRTENYTSLEDLYKKTRSEGFGDEVKRRIMAGAYSLSTGHSDEYYKRALKLRTLIKDDFDKAYEDFDLLVSPTTPNLPFKFGEKLDNPFDMYKSDVFTAPVNLAGLCALSLPCKDLDGLPVGIQFIGNRFEEEKILRAGLALEKELNYGGDR